MMNYTLQEIIKQIYLKKEKYLTKEEKDIYKELINYNYENFIDIMKTPNETSIKFTKIFEEFLDASDMQKVFLQSDILIIFKSLKTKKEEEFLSNSIVTLGLEALAGEYIIKSTNRSYPLSLCSIHGRLLYDLGIEQNESAIQYFDSINDIDEEKREELEYKIRQIYDYQSGEYLYNYQEIFLPNCRGHIRNLDEKLLIQEMLDNYKLKKYIYGNLDIPVVTLHREIQEEIISYNLPKNKYSKKYADVTLMHSLTHIDYDELNKKRLTYYKTK